MQPGKGEKASGGPEGTDRLMSDSLLQQLWEAYAAHEGRKHKRATRGLVAPTDLDRFRTDFNRIIKSVKVEAVHAFIREASRHVEDHISITALWHLAPGRKNDA